MENKPFQHQMQKHEAESSFLLISYLIYTSPFPCSLLSSLLPKQSTKESQIISIIDLKKE